MMAVRKVRVDLSLGDAVGNAVGPANGDELEAMVGSLGTASANESLPVAVDRLCIGIAGRNPVEEILVVIL